MQGGRAARGSWGGRRVKANRDIPNHDPYQYSSYLAISISC